MVDCKLVLHTQINLSCTNVFTCALVLYEHLITLSQEVEVIWQRKRSLPVILFLVNRYNILVNSLILLFIYMRVLHDTTTFGIMNFLISVSSIVAYCMTAAFTAFRAYALSAKDSRRSCIILALSLAPAIGKLICLVVTHPRTTMILTAEGPVATCDLGLTMDPGVHTQLTMASEIPSLIADTLVLALTWTKTLDQYGNLRRMRRKTSLNDLFLRDGTIYFLVLLALDVAQLATSRTACIAHLQYTLSSVLVSRFLLNLRQVDKESSSQPSTRWISSLCFAEVHSTLSQPLVLPGDACEAHETPELDGPWCGNAHHRESETNVTDC